MPYKQTTRANFLFHAFLLLVVGFSTLFPLWQGGEAWLALPGLILIPIWAVFSAVTVELNDHTLRIRFGPVGPKIPIRAITGATSVNYSALAYGGWGIRKGQGKTVYNVLGDGGRAVQIDWNDNGVPKTHLVSSTDPDTLLAAIERARSEN